MKRLVTLVLALAMIGAVAIPASSEGGFVKLTWVQGTGADAPVDVAVVNEALNIISREKLGVEVDILYMTGDQVNTSILAGEVYDMYFTCDWYNDYVTQSYAGIFADITDLLPAVTPELYATMPEIVWEGAKVNGRIYAIPVKKDYAPEMFIQFDKEFFASIGMEIPFEMDLLDLEPYLIAWKEAFPDRYPLMFSRVPPVDGTFNFLNRPARIGFAYDKVGTPEGTKIISVFEDEYMVKRFTALHDWYLKGYINPDAATLDATSIDGKQNHIRFGQGFYGADAIWSAANNFAIQISRFSGPFISASGVRGSMNAFSSALESDPERLELALKYQEIVNTDLKYRDTLRYGIEGQHFNYNEDGTVTVTDEGRSNYRPWQFSQGSYALSSVEASSFPSVPVDPNMWDVVFKGYENALVAADFGFTFDPSDYERQIADLVVILDKWVPQIYTGTADPAEVIPACIAELESAGLRDVIAGAQAQLDAYLAAP